MPPSTETPRRSRCFRRCPLWVLSAGLSSGRQLPVFTDKQTIQSPRWTSREGQMRTNASLDCLVSAAKKGYGYRETECFGGLEIDHEL